MGGLSWEIPFVLVVVHEIKQGADGVTAKVAVACIRCLWGSGPGFRYRNDIILDQE